LYFGIAEKEVDSTLELCLKSGLRGIEMESAMMAIISVGAHPELVRLRDFVLQEAGFHVVSTLDEHEALARIERGECSVLLVCSSLAKATRRRLADALRKSCPGSRMVLITNEHIEKPEFADFFVYGVEGPEALIGALSAAVEKRRSAQA
jgi:CheY-like chemotaxis protein